VQFSIWAAVRKAAAVNLRWDHVNLEDQVATIYLKAQGRPKPHVIALTARMVELIDAQPRVEGCPYVFTYECVQNTRDRTGKMKFKGQRYPFSQAGWTKVWLRALKAAGLTGFRFHDLRHTGATRLTRATGDIQLTQATLGHADMKTTMRYSRVSVGDLRAAQERAQR
jgi:integrase